MVLCLGDNIIMMPLKVRFTGLEIDPMDVLSPRRMKNEPIPVSWIRFQFDIERGDDTTVIEKWINSWIVLNSDAQWAMYSYREPRAKKDTVVIAFADSSDAMMFKLKDGEIAWKDYVEK